MADALFLNTSIIVISPALETVPEMLLQQLHPKLHRYKSYFCFIFATCKMVIAVRLYPGCTFNTGNVADALAVVLLQIQASGFHSSSTPDGGQNNATTAQLHLSRKFGTPLHLLAVPLKHGLISTSVEKTMLLPQRSLLKIVLFSSWNVVTNIYQKI